MFRHNYFAAHAQVRLVSSDLVAVAVSSRDQRQPGLPRFPLSTRGPPCVCGELNSQTPIHATGVWFIPLHDDISLLYIICILYIYIVIIIYMYIYIYNMYTVYDQSIINP